MKKKHHIEEQIVSILRAVDGGLSVEEAYRDYNISNARCRDT